MSDDEFEARLEKISEVYTLLESISGDAESTGYKLPDEEDDDQNLSPEFKKRWASLLATFKKAEALVNELVVPVEKGSYYDDES